MEVSRLPVRAVVGGIASAAFLIVLAPVALVAVKLGALPSATTHLAAGLVGASAGSLCTILPVALWHDLRDPKIGMPQWAAAGAWGGIFATLIASAFATIWMVRYEASLNDLKLLLPIMLVILCIFGVMVGALAHPIAHFYARSPSHHDA